MVKFRYADILNRAFLVLFGGMPNSFVLTADILIQPRLDKNELYKPHPPDLSPKYVQK